MQYRIVAMLPTEMYVEGESIETAIETVNWLSSEYPGVEYPMIDTITEGDDGLGKAMPKILSVEESTEEVGTNEQYT